MSSPTYRPLQVRSPSYRLDQIDSASEKVTIDNDDTPLKLGYHPLTLILCIFWAGGTIALVYLLHKTASVSQNTPVLPWKYDELPTILSTIFAQFHLGITAAYLGRLTISAITLNGRKPLSPKEVFWQADKEWQNPLGIVKILTGRRKISKTTFLLIVTSVIAILTPTILGKGYPVVSLDVLVNQTTLLQTVSRDRIKDAEAYAQLSLGGGIWASGSSAPDLFNNSVYSFPKTSRDSTKNSDILFSGRTFLGDATLDGIRMQGGCSVIEDGPVNNFYGSYCQNITTDSARVQGGWNATGIIFSIEWCSNSSSWPSQWDSKTASASATTRLYVNSTDTSPNPITPAVFGVIECNATWSTGIARLDGRNLTFTNFQSVDFAPGSVNGGEAVIHPLNAAHILIAQSEPQEGTIFSDTEWLNMLGYKLDNLFDPNKNQTVVQPTIDQMATRVWYGAQHMTVALQVLYQGDPTNGTVTYHVASTGRKVDHRYAYVAWGLVGGWIVLLVLLTVMLFRRAYESDLNSSAVAKLLAERRDLIYGSTRRASL